MFNHITTIEAKKLALPGFDVYQYSHLLYHDDLNRDFGVVRLNIEAIKAFSDTVTITKRHELEADQTAINHWMSLGGLESSIEFPWWGDATRSQMEYVNYEHLKIASAFELHLKARLLARNYILHEIDSKSTAYKFIAGEQAIRPINKNELFAIQPYHFDGKKNYLPGLRLGSIKFSWLTDKPAYSAAIGLTDQELNIIREYRLLRNQIHFPGDVLETPSIHSLNQPIVNFLTEFINSNIIDPSNSLIGQYKMNYQQIPLFS